MKKVFKFYSDTCGPCKAMTAQVNKLKNVEINNININDENNDSLIDKYDIKSIPTVVVVSENGDVEKSFRGIVPSNEIQEVVDNGNTEI